MEMPIGGEDISNILNSTGSIVKCVLLRATTQNATREKSDDLSSLSAATDSSPTEANRRTTAPQAAQQPDYELAHLVSQISINTAPKERAVEKTLGGPFTFLGQYEDRGIIAMALRDPEVDSPPPTNEHVLQPPLHGVKNIAGDILLMKVRNEDADEGSEFFLDLTRDEYLEFASRTDIVAEEKDDGVDMESDEEEEEDEDVVEEYDGEEDSEDEEVGGADMFETLMGHIVQRFVTQNGRAPNAAELLNIRRALEQKLGENVGLVSSDEEEEVDQEQKDETH